MWCRTCQQDVPAASSPEGASAVCCVRCGNPFAPAEGAHVGTASERTAASNRESPQETDSPREAALDASVPSSIPSVPPWDDFGFEDDLRRVERIVRQLRSASLTHRTDVPSAAGEAPAWHVPLARARKRGRHPAWTVLAWGSLMLGLTSLVCGGVLSMLAWSYQRPSLWPLGLPLMLAGQILILLGMLGLLDPLGDRRRDEEPRVESLSGGHSISAPHGSASIPTSRPGIRQ